MVFNKCITEKQTVALETAVSKKKKENYGSHDTDCCHSLLQFFAQ